MHFGQQLAAALAAGLGGALAAPVMGVAGLVQRGKVARKVATLVCCCGGLG